MMTAAREVSASAVIKPIRSVDPKYDSYECLAEETRIIGRSVCVARRL